MVKPSLLFIVLFLTINFKKYAFPDRKTLCLAPSKNYKTDAIQHTKKCIGSRISSLTASVELFMYGYINLEKTHNLPYTASTIGSTYSNISSLSQNISPATLEQFGAKGDGVTDDTQAISKALNSTAQIIYARQTRAYYKITNLIVINNVNRKKLIATNCKFLNTDLTKATFLFQNSKNIEIQGGEFGYAQMPVKNGGNSQHVFQFEKCRNVIVNKIHIRNSPEMGIAITNSNQATVKNSLIEHTFRDGTYSHYSANVSYLSNRYKHIKDDAMSFHDYGIDSEKTTLSKFGYSQSTNLVATNNTVDNAYQGFASIGSNRVKVSNNNFRNTVLAGIAIFNSKELYNNGTSLVRNVQIINNRVDKACNTVIINGISYANNGQASTGRAAIFVGSLGSNNQINAGETKRLTNILVQNNKVSHSYGHGFFANFIDQLQFVNNEFTDCSGPVPEKSLSGDVIEIGNVTNFFGDKNTIIDKRVKVQHQHAYAFNNVTGTTGSWIVKGVAISESLFTSMPRLKTIQEVKRQNSIKYKVKE